MIKKAVQIGNPIVRKQSINVPLRDISNSKTKSLINDLVDSMKFYKLIGMAAPQIGKNLNVFVIQLRDTPTRKAVKKTDRLQVFINPILKDFSTTQTVLMEGCGSLVTGQLFGPVKRPRTVTVSAYNENGNKFEFKASGLLAKALQHEYDHLKGIICIDKFTDSKKVTHRDEYRKNIK